MFFKLYRYSILQTMRQKLTIFWSLLFPIIMGTLFRVSFGDFMNETVVFHQIPVAYVTEEEQFDAFQAVLESLEEEEGLVELILVDREEAEALLKDEKVEGIYQRAVSSAAQNLERETIGIEQSAEDITLTVTKKGINQSILSSVLEQYQRTFQTMEHIAREQPAGIEAAASVIREQCQYLKAGTISDTPKGDVTDYFYALIAMNCLMGVIMGLQSALEFKANLSPLAARRVMASTHRFGILLPDLAAKLTIQFLCTVFSVCYLMFAMQVSLGEKFPLVLLTTLLGSLVGIFWGFFVGAAGTYKETVKEGICIAGMLFSGFLAGMMVGGMYRFLETHMPVINRINPASLISHALYSLDIYQGYEKYVQCMVSLLLIAVLLGVCGFALVRRERYASI